MKENRLTPKPGMQAFSNTGFGNRCAICGGFFDVSSNICPNGHRFGDWFFSEEEEYVPPIEKKKEGKEICQEFNGRCTLCGSFFEDDVCQNGHHLGDCYPE